jgi:hypothetical protein
MLFIGGIRERLSIVALNGDEYADALQAAAARGIVGGGRGLHFPISDSDCRRKQLGGNSGAETQDSTHSNHILSPTFIVFECVLSRE